MSGSAPTCFVGLQLPPIASQPKQKILGIVSNIPILESLRAFCGKLSIFSCTPPVFSVPGVTTKVLTPGKGFGSMVLPSRLLSVPMSLVPETGTEVCAKGALSGTPKH